MAQRDYILRIIEQLGAALAELRRRVLNQEGDDLRGDLERVSGQAGFDIDLLRGFDFGTLHLLITQGGEVDVARCWLMAEVLYLDGLDATISGTDGSDSLRKARGLYEMVRPAGGMLVGIPEALERIAEIDRWLGEPDEPNASQPRRGRSVSTRRRSPAALELAPRLC
ncbi:MAG: hypothetical protein AAF389_03545 [Gemmatimonadota bacterium]